MNGKKPGIIPLIAGIVILLLALTGCQNTASLGEEFILRIGQSVVIKGEDLKITFSAVSGDSRCPAGAECVRAGEVACLMEIEQDGEDTYTEFAYPGLTDDYSRLTYQEYNYTFKVEPYPEIDKAIAKSEYRLFLTVN
jgi:hypothetical protein